MEKPVEKTRREVLKEVGAAALTAVPVYGMGGNKAEAGVVHPEQNISPVSEPESWQDVEVPLIHKTKPGLEVLVSELMEFEPPAFTQEDIKQILKSHTGLIISKRFHRFWFFKEGVLELKGPVGTANYIEGYDTPEGLQEVYRKEGENYSSKEFPSYDPNVPNMAYATFFNNRGIAFHGSLNFVDRGGMQFLKIDNSHGCVNARKSDAEIINQAMNYGDKVTVLP